MRFQKQVAGKVCIEAQGRSTHRCRPPSPPVATSAENKSGSNAQWEPLYSQKVAFFWQPASDSQAAEALDSRKITSIGT